MMKKTIIELDKILCNEFGKRHTTCFEQDDGTIMVGVSDDFDRDEVKEVIVNAGYDIIKVQWFSGSDWDGNYFTVK